MRRIVATVATVALIAGAIGCAPLPPEGAVDVTAGPLSDQFQVQWDPVLNVPIRMLNRSLQSEPEGGEAVSEEEAASAVRVVIEQYATWFHWRPGIDDFRVANSYARGFLRFMRIVQTYRGITVAGEGYDVRVLSSGRVGSLEGHIQPNLAVDVIPVITAEQAAGTAVQAIAASGTPLPSLPRFQLEYESGFREPAVQVLMPVADRFVLAWGVVISRRPYGSWRVYVDARSGTVLGYQTLEASLTR